MLDQILGQYVMAGACLHCEDSKERKEIVFFIKNFLIKPSQICGVIIGYNWPIWKSKADQVAHGLG